MSNERKLFIAGFVGLLVIIFLLVTTKVGIIRYNGVLITFIIFIGSWWAWVVIDEDDYKWGKFKKPLRYFWNLLPERVQGILQVMWGMFYAYVSVLHALGVGSVVRTGLSTLTPTY